MRPGPVFARELLTTARRRRYYAIRSLYGLVLLLILWGNYGLEGHAYALTPGYIRARLGVMTEAIVRSFAIAQVVAVLAMTPALVAGTIADEKQRRTLPYLLASRLTGREIVLDKLLARLLHVAVLLAIGPPVIGLLSVFGGVDPAFVGLAYAAAASTAFFAAALSILASTLARSAREAIFLAYVLELAWLFLPMIYAEAPAGTWPEALDGLGVVNGWVYASSPFALAQSVMYGINNPFAAAGREERVAWMSGLQVAFGAGLLLLAVAGLRRVSAGQGGPARHGFWTAPRHWRVLARPACGDAPMAWKERHAAPPGGLARVVAGPIAVAAAAIVGYLAIAEAGRSFAMVEARGYGPAPRLETFLSDPALGDTRNAQQDFNIFLRASTAVLQSLWVIGVAIAAAGSVTTEREEDTWTSLVATPLDGRTILRSKMIGAAWRGRGLAALMLALWSVGVAAGAVHPIGLVASAAMLAISIWFYAAIGTWASLRSATTLRALALAMGAAFIFSGGYLIVPTPAGTRIPAVTGSNTFALQQQALLSYRDVAVLADREHLGRPADATSSPFDYEPYRRAFYSPFAGPDGGQLLTTCLIAPLVYAAAAAGLTFASFRAFDRVVDRPRRGRA